NMQKQYFQLLDNTITRHSKSRITNDLFDIGELAHHGPEDFFIDIMTVVGAFFLMFNINPELALITIVMVPLLIIVISFCNKLMNRAWTNMYGKIADVNARVEDSASGARVVRSCRNEAYEIDRFRVDDGNFRRAKIVAYKVMAWTTASMYMMTRLMTLLVLVIGAWFTVNGKLTHGELVGFILFTNILINPVDKISALLELYPKGMAGFKRFRSLIDQEPEIQDEPNAIEVDH